VESGEWREECGERRVRVESGEWRVESGERREESEALDLWSLATERTQEFATAIDIF